MTCCGRYSFASVEVWKCGGMEELGSSIPPHFHTCLVLRSFYPRQNHLIVRVFRAGPAHSAAVGDGLRVYQSLGGRRAGGLAKDEAFFRIPQVDHLERGAVGLAGLGLSEAPFGIGGGD